MKYDELFDFEPILSVIQLREADSRDRAINLVETFVVSDRMADQLANVVFPNLQFEEPADNKGVLVVGNYGTGKSHLMSLISALAEHPDAVGALRNPTVAAAAQAIAGKFKVVRREIGSTEMSLRDIICTGLTDALREMGVDYKFPPVDQVSNNKDALEEMMGQFNAKYPDQGLLLVLDELLDYLRTRQDHKLILDLNFLREIGEVCRSVRFRFVSGLQESLFDNPRFQFVADSVIRVRDRFQQLRIVREDVAFVVSERLLKKTPAQQARVREHLEQFAPLYEAMAERMEEFVRLFPVHPAYLDLFERLAVAEKREVLRTLSMEMQKLVGTNVPTDEPGLLGYDSYWLHLRENAALRSVPEVREVLDKSNVLETRIEQAFTRPQYRPMALRICRALAVQRLATDDIYAPIGPTAEELRDGLCLYIKDLPEKTSDFLQTSVEACLREISKTMSGQYISHNTENGQYYLDLKKDIDYDAKIADRAESLSNSQLDRYYFDAVTRLMECTDQTYVTGYKIWEHEVEWIQHKVTRRGYLFFGAPNERSTAQPPRDFYVYFLQPHEPPSFKDAKLADEVFFALKHPDEDLTRALRLYGGAREMAAQATAGARKVYEDKGNEHLRTMTEWLRNHMLKAYEVSHQGVTRKMADVLKGHRTGGGMAVRDLVNLVGSVCLAAAFDERYPGYPVFDISLTTANVGQAVEDTIRVIAGGQLTQTSSAILDGLVLLDNGRIKPQQSPYGKAVLEKLAAVEANQVLNRKDLMVSEHGLWWEAAHRLEPELFVVVLLSLVYTGDVVLSLPGKKLDAANLPEAARTSLEDLCAFKHIERPKDIPIGALVALFELLGLPDGLIRNVDNREEGIRKLHERVGGIVQQLVMTSQQLQGGFPWWGGALVAEDQQTEYRGELDSLKTFLERLQPFNTPGKLRNFPFTVQDVNDQAPNLQRLDELQSLRSLLEDLNPLATYLTTAEQVVAQDDPWLGQVGEARTEWRTKMLDSSTRSAADFRHKITQALNQIKQVYTDRYAELHQRVRLGIGDDDKKKKLLGDPRMQDLALLAVIQLLPHASLIALQNQINQLRSCFEFTKESIQGSPICPFCGFRPALEETGANAAVILSQMDSQLEALVTDWTRILLVNLSDPTAEQSIELLEGKQKKAVTAFIKAKQLPDKVTDDLVQGIQTALAGLEPIVVTPGDLLKALCDLDPCTVEQFRSRFDAFMQALTKGKDTSKVRIRVDEDHTGGQ
jgi:energy-coupling factor transporter ATP-binding protein EcfA2